MPSVGPRTTTMRHPDAKADAKKKCLDEFDEEDDEWRGGGAPEGDAPDGGWGWMVLLASFVNIVVVDGICFTYGMIMSEYKRVFGFNQSEVGWLGSTLAGTYLLMGEEFVHVFVVYAWFSPFLDIVDYFHFSLRIAIETKAEFMG